MAVGGRTPMRNWKAACHSWAMKIPASHKPLYPAIDPATGVTARNRRYQVIQTRTMRLCDNHPERTMEATETNSIALTGKQEQCIEFDGCMVMLERAGRQYFGPFCINPPDYKIIFLLLVYFYHDLQSTEGYGIDLKKGILLAGL
jgi:hypothetical protein